MQDADNWRSDALIAASGVAAQVLAPAALYVVATPIGNLADVTLRALWVLSHVDAIAAEDTRQTRQLLARYRIPIPTHGLLAAHAHNERGVIERIVALLAAGCRVALVSDAGTPAISDPGARIVRTARAAGHAVVPVPGPSSLTAVLSVAGLEHGAVRFIGFLPASPRERDRALAAIAADVDATVLFEAPHRLRATLSALAAVLPAERRVLIARELTKKFERIEQLTAAALPDFAERHAPRGEYVLLVEGAPAEVAPSLDPSTRRWLVALAQALPPARAAAVAAQATGLPRDLLYRTLTQKAQAN
ncbi:MAG: 16S rRNA (cytidine(1402)-2'-O)-methyltransferase [Burkholderiaceae bacterium]|nr:16S rRNA (cytidine(1402)-2'-O)-methyltransferase [Burkholderiaceae bacterium]